MLRKDFNRLLKKENAKRIIYMHCDSKITLTEAQLNKVIDLKNNEGKRK